MYADDCIIKDLTGATLTEISSQRNSGLILNFNPRI